MNPRLSSHRGHPNQLITSGPRPLLCGVRRDLMRGTSEKCTLPAIRLCQPTPLTAPRQRLHPAHPRSNACAISTAQDYHPKVWSHSISGIGSASTPALCNSRSCPASTLRFAVWSNSSSGIASNTASGAASSCPIFISSGGERDGGRAEANCASDRCARNLAVGTF